MQVIYQIISAYFEDDCADELTNEPVMTAILDKDAFYCHNDGNGPLPSDSVLLWQR